MNKNQYMFIASKKRTTMYSFTMSCSYFLTIYFCFVLWMLWRTFMPKINLGSVVRILRCVYIDWAPDKLPNVIARGCLKLNYIYIYVWVCVYLYICTSIDTRVLFVSVVIVLFYHVLHRWVFLSYKCLAGGCSFYLPSVVKLKWCHQFDRSLFWQRTSYFLLCLWNH